MSNDVAPGWFADPTDATQMRYWDGAAWTDDVSPARGRAPMSSESTREIEVDDDDLEALMGIPDDRDWNGRVRGIALGTLVGLLLLVAGWSLLARGDGDGAGAATFFERDESAEVLGTTETTSTTTAPTPSTTAALARAGQVTGLSVVDAQAALEAAGLATTVTEVEDASADPGVVISQDPAAGDVAPGSVVALTVAIAPVAECNDADGQIPSTTFVDVLLSGSPADAIAVGWAQHADIISGVQPGVFGVNVPLSRAELVTMLHRYFCEPEPDAASSFVDVADGDFYADAAAWATDEGIVSGTSDGAFDPSAPTTRAQWVTVLWRALGQPPGNGGLVFTDVPADAFYEPALRWAVANNLVAGTTPSTFSPDAPLSRLDATALLYLLESTIDPTVS